MEITFDREKRQEQKDLLKKIFVNYLPVHHDAFVMEYNRIVELSKLTEYMNNRGLI
jgi:hypothetical protein